MMDELRIFTLSAKFPYPSRIKHMIITGVELFLVFLTIALVIYGIKSYMWGLLF